MRLMRLYNIADVTVGISGIGADYLPCNFEKYMTDSIDTPDIHFELDRRDIIPCGKELVRESGSMRVYRKGRDRVYQYGDRDKPRLEITHNSDFSDINMALSVSDRPKVPSSILEYVYMGTFFYYYMSLLGGLMIHGSAIDYLGSGIIFTAPSGMGKSTHTHLWRQLFGDRVQIINDDKPLVMCGNGYRVVGTPFSGSDYEDNNISSPLRAIVILERASIDRVSGLSGTELIMRMTEGILRPYENHEVYDKMLTLMGRVVTDIPCYKLSCTPTAEAVRAIFARLKEDNLIR